MHPSFPPFSELFPGEESTGRNLWAAAAAAAAAAAILHPRMKHDRKAKDSTKHYKRETMVEYVIDPCRIPPPFPPFPSFPLDPSYARQRKGEEGGAPIERGKKKPQALPPPAFIQRVHNVYSQKRKKGCSIIMRCNRNNSGAYGEKIMWERLR